MAFSSCDDTDDGLQKQAKISESLDFSVAPFFKIKKNADHHDTLGITLNCISLMKKSV